MNAAGDGFLHELQDELAMIAATRRNALDLRERADVLDRAAAARESVLEERVAEVLRDAAPAFPAAPPSRRPRLEESTNPGDRRRAAKVVALLQRSPHLPDREIAKRSSVSPSVVKRLRDALAEKVIEKVVDKSP